VKPGSLAARKPVLLAELLTNNLKQRIMDRLSKVYNRCMCSISPIASSTNSDTWNPTRNALGDQERLIFITVDRIKNHIKRLC
jgi:hypothetical protein